MDNNLGNKKTYIVTAVVVILVLIMMFVLLNLATNAAKGKKRLDPINTTTKAKDEPVIVSNFASPLSLVIGDLDFNRNYDYEIRYSGAKFNFKCQEYDEEESICTKGNAVMDVGTTTVDLFTYEKQEDNFLNKSNEFYIMVNDDFIILTFDGITPSEGKAIIKKRNGEDVRKLDSIITKYKDSDGISGSFYPTIVENEFNYYKCVSSKVKIASIDLNSNSEESIIEDISDGICN